MVFVISRTENVKYNIKYALCMFFLYLIRAKDFKTMPSCTILRLHIIVYKYRDNCTQVGTSEYSHFNLRDQLYYKLPATYGGIFNFALIKNNEAS